jgi:hypothetical protein
MTVKDSELQLRAHELLKQNIDTLLKARGQSRAELAKWCGRSRSWLDKAFSEPDREIPLKYLDRIADYFGFATYQLLQPGITALTERRSGHQRRSGRDRRISAASAVAEPRTAVDLMDLIRAISLEGRQRAIPVLTDILNDELRELRRRPAIPSVLAVRDRTPEKAKPTRVPTHDLVKK